MRAILASSPPREFLSGPLRTLYLFDEANLPLVAAMDAFLLNKMSSWRKACDQPN
ncbi:MAG TPA: hypothetical protein VKB74_02215 [Burkholderiales bacterium]|nr:hypothetical protein [Burkholderiales bacterium]